MLKENRHRFGRETPVMHMDPRTRNGITGRSRCDRPGLLNRVVSEDGNVEFCVHMDTENHMEVVFVMEDHSHGMVTAHDAKHVLRLLVSRFDDIITWILRRPDMLIPEYTKTVLDWWADLSKIMLCTGEWDISEAAAGFVTWWAETHRGSLSYMSNHMEDFLADGFRRAGAEVWKVSHHDTGFYKKMVPDQAFAGPSYDTFLVVKFPDRTGFAYPAAYWDEDMDTERVWMIDDPDSLSDFLAAVEGCHSIRGNDNESFLAAGEDSFGELWSAARLIGAVLS